MLAVCLCDANVLYPSTLRDLLLRLALERVIQVRTTEKILDETFRNLQTNRPDLDPARLQRTRALMIGALPDLIVTGYEARIDQLTLPDRDDRHVLAAAIAARAEILVTSNLKDFPAEALAPHGITAEAPDEFLTGLLDVAGTQVVSVARDMATAWRAPDATIEQVLDSLSTHAPRAAARVRNKLRDEA